MVIILNKHLNQIMVPPIRSLISSFLSCFEEAKLITIHNSIAKPYVVSIIGGDSRLVTLDVNIIKSGAGI